MKKRFLFLYLGILFPFSLLANDNIINEVDSLIELSKRQKNNVEIQSSAETAYLALNKSIEADYSKGKSASYLELAKTLFYLGNYSKSLEYLSLTESEPYSSKNPKTLFEICRIRGQIYSYLKLDDESIKEFLNCISLTKNFTSKEDRDYGLSLSYENLSIVYLNLDMTDSVNYYLNKNKELLMSMDESSIYLSLVNLYTSIGEWHSNNCEYDLANQNFTQALSIADKYQYPYLSRTFMYMGDMQTRKSNSDSAFYYYHKALNNLEKTKIKGEFGLVYNKLSILHESSGNIDSARIYKEQKDLIETELSAEREKSFSEVLKIFVNEEKKAHDKQKRKTAIIISISAFFLITIGVIIWMTTYSRLSKRKDKLKVELNESIREAEAIEKKIQILEKKVNASFDEIIILAKSNDPSFLRRFQEVYPEHTNALLQIHPNLSKTELILCALLYLHFSTKDIAVYTYVEYRSVQTKKTRLRRKLNLPSGANLTDYLHSLN